MRHFLLFLLAFGPCVSAQTQESLHTLSDSDPLTSDAPYGLALDPDGIHLYVALAGDLAPFGTPQNQVGQFNNDKVLKIDRTTGAVVASASVGFFPEEIALRLDSAGQLTHLYVTNSTDGTLSILDASLNPLGTLTLSPCFGANFMGTFPFGVAVSPDGSRAVVGTAGGCGDIDLIDTDPASPSFGTLLQSFSFNGTFGRPVWIDLDTVVFPQTVCDPGFSWCQGAALILEVDQPANSVSVPLTAQINFNYDSATDSVLLPNGRVLITVGFGNAPHLFELDPATAAVTGHLDLSGASGNGAHGLALSPDGRTAAMTLFSSFGEILFVDVASLSVIGSHDTTPGGGAHLPNDAVYSQDGSRLYVTLQGADSLLELRDLPGHAFRLDAPTTLAVGSSGALAIDNLEPGRRGDLYFSLSSGPSVVSGISIELGLPIAFLGSATGDSQGDGSLLLAVPPAAQLSGLSVWFQAATFDASGVLRLSNGARIDLL